MHVLPEGHFAARRLSGAVNACTYETAFLDKVREMAPALDARIVVHGEGALNLAAGSLLLADGKLAKGEFTIDMDSIACSDIPDSGVAAMLVGHLRTADFFQVAEQA